MKLLVGIMHTIENEFEACVDAIKQQTHQDFDYFVIENLPNKEAHDTLYQKFMDNADKYDLFVKIDADMVLCRTTFFEEVVKKMRGNPDIGHLEVAVHDFFTDRLIYGLNTFRNTVKWDTRSCEVIFVDRIVESYNHTHDNYELAPAAYHCPNPSDFQAFHFGLHKAVKVIQINSPEINSSAAKEHWRNITLLHRNYSNKKDEKLGMAILGVHWALKQKATYKYVDFNNSITKEYVSTLNYDSNSVNKLVQNFLSYPNGLLLEWTLFKSSQLRYRAYTRFLRYLLHLIIYQIGYFLEKAGEVTQKFALSVKGD